ncbi:hypothetical protein LA080_012581 [Diaporthe eres]|nr:hypothetical protein LA080_012581 [Diaporthe eres]
MDEKPHAPSAVFVPFTDEDYVGINSVPTGTVEPYYHPGQRPQFQFRRLVYVSIVAMTLCFAGFTFTRYPMTIRNQQIPETASGNHVSSLHDSSSIDKTWILGEKPCDDPLPMIIPINGVRCPRNNRIFTQAAIQNAYDAGATCAARGCNCTSGQLGFPYPKYFANWGDGVRIFPLPPRGTYREFPIVPNGDLYCYQSPAGGFRVVWDLFAGARTYTGVIEKQIGGNLTYSACNAI